MFDLKVINSVLAELEETRGIPKERVIEAIEAALATAYRKEFGKRGQIIRAKFDLSSGKVDFFQVKTVVDDTRVVMTEEDLSIERTDSPESMRVLFNTEHDIMLDDARLIKKDAQIDDEIIFPLEAKADFGRIASQTAKQVIMQKIREAEKVSVVGEFGKREGQIITGTVQRIERGNIFIDLGRATGLLSYDERIPGEHFSQGERVRAYLYKVEETPRGVFLRLSRAHPKFVEELFKLESPEVQNGTVAIKAIAREAGSRTKIAAFSDDSHVDPVGSLVGQRGVRVSTVMSELGGEKIDIIEWSQDPKTFIEDSLSPAKVMEVVVDEANQSATVEVSEDQQSLAIGRGGQNVRLAAKLTGWKIDIKSMQGKELAHAEANSVKAEVITESPVEEIKTEEKSEVPVIEEVPEIKPES